MTIAQDKIIDKAGCFGSEQGCTHVDTSTDYKGSKIIYIALIDLSISMPGTIHSDSISSQCGLVKCPLMR